MKDKQNKLEKLIYPYGRIFYEFFIFSFIGLVFETLYVYFMHGIWTIRGTLGYGLPIIHIYGIGVLLVVYLLGRFKGRPVVFFISTTMVMTLVELSGSYIEEYLIGVRSWNYMYLPFNYDGRISLLISIVWGFMSFVIIYFMYPRIRSLIEKIPRKFLSYSSIFLTIYVIIGILRKYILRY